MSPCSGTQEAAARSPRLAHRPRLLKPLKSAQSLISGRPCLARRTLRWLSVTCHPVSTSPLHNKWQFGGINMFPTAEDRLRVRLRKWTECCSSGERWDNEGPWQSLERPMAGNTCRHRWRQQRYLWPRAAGEGPVTGRLGVFSGTQLTRLLHKGPDSSHEWK